jgi:amino-acid N-acetyltransferase
MVILYPLAPPVTIRPARVVDAPAIHALIEVYAREGKLLPRTLDQVYRMIREFVVADDGGQVVGCAALRIYHEHLAEIAALAVVERWQGRGVGRRMVETLKSEARALGVPRVFALTIDERFFHKLGFRTVPVVEFPEKITQDCRSCAKRTGCIEIAVLCELEPEAPPNGKA